MEYITITIAGIEYKIKQSFRALMMFEEMTGKSVNQVDDSVADILKLFYCILKGNNLNTFTYTFDEYLDIIDEQPEVLTQFTDYLEEKSKGVPEQQKKRVTKKK